MKIKSEKELNKEIFATTKMIQENYPELLQFEDEMTITIPCEKNPVISATELKDYKDSLQEMATEYAKSSAKIMILVILFL